VMALPILGVVVIPLLWRALSPEGSGASLDVIGAVLVAATAAGLVLLVQSPATGVLIAVTGGVLLVLGVPAVTWRVRRRPFGFLPLSVVRDATVVRSSLAAAAIPAAWFAHLVAVPAVLVHDGWEAWQVGLLLVPSALLALAMPHTAGTLLARIGPTAALGLAGIVSTVALLLASLGTWLVSPVVLVVAVALVTVAFGLGQPALMAAVGESVAIDVRGVALGVATLLFLVGGSVGSAAVGGLGELAGIPASLAVLAALPLLGLLALLPELRRVREPV
jgi:hypothetical protein